MAASKGPAPQTSGTLYRCNCRNITYTPQVYLKELTCELDIKDLAERLAALTPGFAGAEIANICNEASGSTTIDLAAMANAAVGQWVTL